MRLPLFRILPLLCISALAACGGGSSTPSVTSSTPRVGPTAAPTTAAPTTGPTTEPAVPAPLATATLKGSPGYVNASKRTVYEFDLDLTSPGQSTCNGSCTQFWPPVAPPAGATLPSTWSTIMRTDGTKQLTYAGRPLYTFVVDTQPGQTNGDGLNQFGGLWHIARPQ